MSVSKNYLYNVLLIISNTIFPIITFPYVSRVLMPEYLGKVYFVQGVVAYFIIIAVLGAPNYGIRELSKAKSIGDWEEFKKIFTELLIMTMGSSIFSLGILIFIVNIYGKFSTEKLLFYIFGAQVLFECFHINYMFVVMENHKRRLVRSFAIRILSLGFLFYFIRTSSDYYLYALLLVVPEIIARIIDIFSVRKYIVLDFKNLNFKRHINNMLIVFMYLFTIGIYGSIDTTMLGLMVNDREVGLYSAAVKMYKMVLPVILTLGTVLSPRIIGAIKKNLRKDIFKNMDIFIDYSFVMGVPATILMVYLAPEFTLLFSGESFQGSIITMMLMTPCIWFVAVGTFIGGQVLLPNNMERYILKVSLVGVGINILLNYFMIPIYLRNGAALATLITEILISLIKINKMKRIYPDYKLFNKDRIFTILMGIVTFLIILLIGNFIKSYGRWITLFSVPIIFGGIYFPLLFVSGNKSVKDGVDMILKIIKK